MTTPAIECQIPGIPPYRPSGPCRIDHTAPLAIPKFLCRACNPETPEAYAKRMALPVTHMSAFADVKLERERKLQAAAMKSEAEQRKQAQRDAKREAGAKAGIYDRTDPEVDALPMEAKRWNPREGRFERDPFWKPKAAKAKRAAPAEVPVAKAPAPKPKASTMAPPKEVAASAKKLEVFKLLARAEGLTYEELMSIRGIPLHSAQARIGELKKWVPINKRVEDGRGTVHFIEA